ncbi:MAG: ABC transporter permease [Microvirgula sp.]
MARKQSLWRWGAAFAAYLFLYLPLVIVVVYSFNDSKLNAEWVGFTTKWYVMLLEDAAMLKAAGNSLMIGVVSSFFATIFGTLAGIAMHRFKLRLLPFLVLTPIAIPELLTGVSLLIFFVLINMTLGLVSIIIAHVAFSIGFVAIVVRARMQGMDDSLVEAARDLGASPWQAFRLITLPQILPGIIAGALMAFTLSIDDFVITFFVAGVGASTLPLQIYSMIKIAVTPEVNAVSTLLMLLTLALIAIATKLSPSAMKTNA